MLLSLLNDILDLSKVEAGKIHLESILWDPKQIVNEINRLFFDAARQKSLKLESSWLGPTAYYLGDPLRLRQMLFNLMGNAVKFTAQGQIDLTACEVNRDKQTALLEFTVSDTGIGIQKDVLPNLFEPFSQADSSTTRQYGGSGLGLSIVRSLAKLMGGNITCESEPGKGSRFNLRIRAALVAANEDTHRFNRPCNKKETTVSSTRLSGQVMVVEDNKINCMVIETMLKRLGLTVVLAMDGQQAIDAITSKNPADLIFMDLHMPIMDGYIATKQIREWETQNNRPRCPIIALTADAFEEDRQRCLATGMDDFLAKPIDFDTLKVTINRWLLFQPNPVSENPGSTTTERAVNIQKIIPMIREVLTLLAEGDFDSFVRFKELQEALAGTNVSIEIAEAGRLMEEFRFDLAVRNLRKLMVEREWDKIA